jgi:transcriptional regulator NrdR family protein
VTEDQLADTAPPLPPGIGTSPDTTRDNQRRPILPITPRLPGNPAAPPGQQQQSPTTPPPAAAQPATTNPAAPPAGTATPPPPGAPPAATPPAPPAGEGAAPPAAPADAGHDHGDEDSSAATKDAADAAAKSPINPQDAMGMLSGLAEPLAGIPSALMGIGSGLLAPFGQILNQFGQGNPAMPNSSGFPQDVLDRLGSTDASTGIAGEAGDAYQSDVDKQANQARAMDNLERKLRTSLQDSASNSTMGRDKIEQIISQVKSALQAMGPIASTPMGQLGVLTTIAQALQQAGAVLTDAVGKDALNADTVKSMSADYIKDLNAGGPNSQEQQQIMAAGGPKAWAIKALAANGITDPRAVANWLPGLMTMGQRESGNNPRAINGSDSNAAAGHPSKGWMQTIDSTFAAHWRPGTSNNIYDPVSNAAAAIHYVMTRYHVSIDGSDLMRKVQQANPYASPKGY